jgi:Secretion system C-terminal sorting domain
MIDNDGKSKYSTVIRLSNKQQSGVSIYPNPVKDIFTLQVTDNKLLRTTAALIDVSGKLIKSITINNLFQTVDITLLTKGMYLVKFEDGSVVKIIKE